VNFDLPEEGMKEPFSDLWVCVIRFFFEVPYHFPNVFITHSMHSKTTPT